MCCCTTGAVLAHTSSVRSITSGTHALRAAHRARLPHPNRLRVALPVGLAIAVLLIGVTLVPAVLEVRDAYRVRAPAGPPARPLLESLTDVTPVSLTTTEAWKKVREVTTAHRVLHDRSLWRRMHFEDWDTVPRSLRERGLAAMMHAYHDALSGPVAWRRMGMSDWDLVPQPIRAIAFLRMTSYWAVREDVGTRFGLQPRRVAQTIGAIVMAESWFEHRAVNENAWGNRDLGLAQCSDHCREELLVMARRGEIAFAPAEGDYFNPFIATRVATVWLARELDRADGDLDLAIRAYHRGIENALDERGDAYLERVLARRRRYVRNIQAPPAWRYLVMQASRRAEG